MRNILLCVCLLSFMPCVLLAAGHDSPLVAVMPFESKNIDAATLQAVTDSLQSKLDEKNVFTLLERSKIDLVFKEQVFQHSGYVDERAAVTIGKMLGATKIIVGSFNKSDSVYIISARIVDVESGKIDRSWTETASSILLINSAVDNLVDTLTSDREFAQPMTHVAHKNTTFSVGTMVSTSLIKFKSVADNVSNPEVSGYNGFFVEIQPIKDWAGKIVYYRSQVPIDRLGFYQTITNGSWLETVSVEDPISLEVNHTFKTYSNAKWRVGVGAVRSKISYYTVNTVNGVTSYRSSKEYIMLLGTVSVGFEYLFHKRYGVNASVGAQFGSGPDYGKLIRAEPVSTLSQLSLKIYL